MFSCSVTGFTRTTSKAMLSKNARGYSEHDIPAAKKFLRNLADMFLSGQVTGVRAASLFADARRAAAKHVQDLTYETHNASRDLKRQFLKHTEWPNLYFAPIRVWSLKKQEIETVQLPFLLPHEVVWSLMQKGSPEIFLQQTNILPEDQQHLAHAARRWGLRTGAICCQWACGAMGSLQLGYISVSGNLDYELHSCADKWRPLRVPLFVIKTCFLQKNVTMDDVFQVLAWSFDALALGCFPRCNHAGQEFSEKFRRKLPGQSLPCRGILTQIRKANAGFPCP